MPTVRGCVARREKEERKKREEEKEKRSCAQRQRERIRRIEVGRSAARDIEWCCAEGDPGVIVLVYWKYMGAPPLEVAQRSHMGVGES